MACETEPLEFGAPACAPAGRMLLSAMRKEVMELLRFSASARAWYQGTMPEPPEAHNIYRHRTDMAQGRRRACAAALVMSVASRTKVVMDVLL